ncbi:HigA family addiction module antitoxin [Rhizobium sullae]|uniref:HigA family addiction module antitoxin n=1 Tax=Rhizobium sullae TaxID=50338 RepID=UPI000B350575|nr:HigA family addiction module antitoxin [Rhizobium sullae]
MSISKSPAIHPGEILREIYMEPLDLTPYSLAKNTVFSEPESRGSSRNKIGISTDTALRLAKFFKTSPEFWMNLQVAYDIKTPALKEALSTIAEVEAAWAELSRDLRIAAPSPCTLLRSLYLFLRFHDAEEIS